MCCILLIHVVQIIKMCCTRYFHMLCKKSHMLSDKFIYVVYFFVICCVNFCYMLCKIFHLLCNS